jgi:hypothetical protein
VSRVVPAPPPRSLFPSDDRRRICRMIHWLPKREPTEPLVDERKPRLINGVHASPSASRVSQETGVFENAQVTGRRGPFVGETTGDFACRRLASKMDRQKNLSSRRMCQPGDNGVQRRQFLGGVICQSCSTSQIVSSSRTEPMGSHI